MKKTVFAAIAFSLLGLSTANAYQGEIHCEIEGEPTHRVQTVIVGTGDDQLTWRYTYEVDPCGNERLISIVVT